MPNATAPASKEKRDDRPVIAVRLSQATYNKVAAHVSKIHASFPVNLWAKGEILKAAGLDPNKED